MGQQKKKSSKSSLSQSKVNLPPNTVAGEMVLIMYPRKVVAMGTEAVDHMREMYILLHTLGVINLNSKGSWHDHVEHQACS